MQHILDLSKSVALHNNVTSIDGTQILSCTLLAFGHSDVSYCMSVTATDHFITLVAQKTYTSQFFSFSPEISACKLAFFNVDVS